MEDKSAERVVLRQANQVANSEDLTAKSDATDQLLKLINSDPSSVWRKVRSVGAYCLVEILQNDGSLGAVIQRLSWEVYILGKIVASSSADDSGSSAPVGSAPFHITLLNSGRDSIRVYAVQTLLDGVYPIQDMISYGVVQRMAVFAVGDSNSSADLQAYAINLLARIAIFGNADAEVVVKEEMAPIFERLVHSKHIYVAAMAVWMFWVYRTEDDGSPMFSEISADTAAHLVKVLRMGDLHLNLKKCALYALSKTAASGHARTALVQHRAVPILVKLLQHLDDEARFLATTTLGSLVGSEAPPMEGDPLLVAMINAGVVPCLVKLLQSDGCLKVKERAAYALGQIGGAAGGVVIEHGAVPVLVESLKRKDSRNLQMNAAWAVSKVSSPDQVAATVDEHDAFPFLRKLAESEDENSRQISKVLLQKIGHGGDSDVGEMPELEVTYHVDELVEMLSRWCSLD